MFYGALSDLNAHLKCVCTGPHQKDGIITLAAMLGGLLTAAADHCKHLDVEKQRPHLDVEYSSVLLTVCWKVMRRTG